MEFIQSISVPAIVTIVYGVIEFLKTAIKSEKFNRLIPVVAALLGGLIGVAAFYVYPTVIPADNVWVALAIGVASGATSVCAHQIYKQGSKGDLP